MSTTVLQAKIGKEKELEAALQHLRGKNADISQEAADIRVTLGFFVSCTLYLFEKLKNCTGGI